jgi:hypothetical protein
MEKTYSLIKIELAFFDKNDRKPAGTFGTGLKIGR